MGDLKITEQQVHPGEKYTKLSNSSTLKKIHYIKLRRYNISNQQTDKKICMTLEGNTKDYKRVRWNK